MILSAIPVIQPLPPVPMAPQSVQKMRDWAQTFGAAVRQRFVRQEKTMARAGTLPSYLYQREIQQGEPVSLERSDLEEQQEKDEEEDMMFKYDSPSSDEESANDETACDVGEIPSLQRRRTFSSEEFLASEEVFASTAEFCSVNFSLFSLL